MREAAVPDYASLHPGYSNNDQSSAFARSHSSR